MSRWTSSSIDSASIDLHEDHALPTVVVNVWFNVGSANERVGRTGFAHFFEHLLFEGSENIGRGEFSKYVEKAGGVLNANTNGDRTYYYEVLPSNQLELGLWLESERMLHARVDQKGVDTQREVVKEEYRQRVLASPYGRLFNGIAPASYRVHPYRRPSIGSIEDLDSATLADVVAFHAAQYRPDNATLVVTGDFEPAQLQAWVDRYFGPLKRPEQPVPRRLTPTVA